MSIRQKTIAGVGWTAAGGAGRQLLQLGLLVVLARLLTPADFGLIAMIAVVTGFLGLLLDAGLSDALVQRRELDAEQTASAFWLIVGVGAALSALMVAAAPLLGRLYEEPRLAPLATVAALQIAARAVGVVPLALLRRRMTFRALSLIELVAAITGGGVAVTLAANGHGAWSLVWQQVTVATVASLLAVALVDRPGLRFRAASLRPLLDFGLAELGFRVFNYAVRHTDDLLVGRWVGAAGLGVYTRAYAVMLMPLRQVTHLFGQVMLPAMSRLGDDLERMRRVYLRANRIVGFFTVPMACGLFVVADDFVEVVFGPPWAAVTPILRVLCLVAVQQPVLASAGWIFLSLGRTDVRLRWAVVSGVVTLLAFVIGIRWGVLGVAIAYTVRCWVLLYHSVVVPGRLIGLGFAVFLRNHLGVTACSLAMAAGVAGADRWLGLEARGAIISLAVSVVIGVALYAALAHLTSIAAYGDARVLVAELLTGRRPAETEAEVES